MKWELSAGSSVTVRCKSYPVYKGFVQHHVGLKKTRCMCRAAQACRCLLRLFVMWVTTSAPTWATPSWSGSLNSTWWSTYGLPFLRYNLLIMLITCSMNPNKADVTCMRLPIPQMQCLLKGSQYKVGGLRDLHLKLMALCF